MRWWSMLHHVIFSLIQAFSTSGEEMHGLLEKYQNTVTLGSPVTFDY